MFGKVIEEFYYTLVSNVPHPTRDNKTSHFFTELPVVRICKGFWQVALVEVDFPISWYNVPQHPEQARNWVISRDLFKLKDPQAKKISSLDDLVLNSRQRTSFVFAHQYGNYLMKILIAEMNKRFGEVDENAVKHLKGYKNYRRWTKLYVDDQNLICSLYVGTGDIVFLSKYLASALRLDQCEGAVKFGDIVEFKGPRLGNSVQRYNDVLALHEGGAYNPVIQAQYGTEYVGSGVPVFPSDTTNIYIYSNIVDYELVGNIETKLLRTVQAYGVFGQQIKHIYTHPLYKKLAYDQLQDIEISIQTDQGKPVEFEYGNVTLVLHFRRIEF